MTPVLPEAIAGSAKTSSPQFGIELVAFRMHQTSAALPGVRTRMRDFSAAFGLACEHDRSPLEASDDLIVLPRVAGRLPEMWQPYLTSVLDRLEDRVRSTSVAE